MEVTADNDEILLQALTASCVDYEAGSDFKAARHYFPKILPQDLLSSHPTFAGVCDHFNSIETIYGFCGVSGKYSMRDRVESGRRGGGIERTHQNRRPAWAANAATSAWAGSTVLTLIKPIHPRIVHPLRDHRIEKVSCPIRGERSFFPK